MTPYSRAKYRLANAEIQTPKKAQRQNCPLASYPNCQKGIYAVSLIKYYAKAENGIHHVEESIKAELNCKLLSFRVHKKENSFKNDSQHFKNCTRKSPIHTWKLESLFLKVTKHDFCCVITGDQSVNFVSKIGVFDDRHLNFRAKELMFFSDLYYWPKSMSIERHRKKVFWFV